MYFFMFPRANPGTAVVEELKRCLFSTTAEIVGKKTVQHVGVVSGELTDYIRLLSAGKTAPLAKEKLKSMKQQVLNELMQSAEGMGANAVVNIRFNIVTMSSLWIVSVAGTAVMVE
ncbi:MAG: YbjQ family protein [Oscillospiraceae bacterium]|nr:YbjQ family protein [Oscillospiraceae bacterium]